MGSRKVDKIESMLIFDGKYGSFARKQRKMKCS
jgi:hypothetical protein